MPKKNPGAWKRLSGAKAKKKPHLEWRVVAASTENLRDELQALTDEKWRVFAVIPHGAHFLIPAYLSAWNTDAPSDETPEEPEA